MFDYRHTRYASYLGYVTQAIVNNLLPLLFLIFQTEYGLSYQQLGSLILVNFTTQLVVDVLAARYADRIGYRRLIVLAHAFAALGLCLLAAAPLLPIPTYGALVLAGTTYAVGGGLIEVLVSPIVECLPTPPDKKASIMSLLHAFYCWGQVSVVALSTLLLAALGKGSWQLLPLFWALVPLCNTLFFSKVPITSPVSDERRTPLRRLFTTPAFLAAMMLMFCAGASELTASQWSSMFAEQGLGVAKIWGDLAGPALFAILMGIGRTIYGLWGERIRLTRFMGLLSCLCVACYLMMTLSPNPVVCLAACALCGFGVSVLWPGAFSLSAARFPAGGTSMFAILAMCGDLGASAGPWLAGTIADRSGMAGSLFYAMRTALFTGGEGGLKTGLLFTTLFPVLLLAALPAFRKK